MSVDFSTVNNYWNLNTGEFQIKGENDAAYALRVYENGKIYINGDIIADGSLTISNLGADTDIVYGNVESGNITKIVGGAIKTQKLEYDEYNYWDLSTGDFVISSKTKRAIYNDIDGLHIDADNITVGTLKSNFIADGITFDKFNGLSVKNDKWKIDFSKKTGGTITIGDISSNSIKSGTLSADRINADEVVADQAFVNYLNANKLTGVQVETGEFNASKITSGTLRVNGLYTGWKPKGTNITNSGDEVDDPGTTVGDDDDDTDYFDPEVKEVEWETYAVPLSEHGGLEIYDTSDKLIGKWDSDGIYATKGYFRYGGSGIGSMFYSTKDQYGYYMLFDSAISILREENNTLTQFGLIYMNSEGFSIDSPDNTFLLGNTYLGYFDNDNVNEEDDYGVAEIGVYCKTTGSGTYKRLIYDDNGRKYNGVTTEITIEVDDDGNITNDTQLHFVNGILVHVGDL